MSRRCRVGAAGLLLAAAVSVPSGLTIAAPDDTMPVPAVCSVSAEPDAIESVADAEALLAATWIRCEGASPLFAVDDAIHVGLGFSAGGDFFRIHRDASGSMIRAEGMLQQGTWEIQGLDRSAAMITMTLTGSGTFHASTTFHETGGHLRLMGEDGVTRDYARWSGPAPEPGRPAGLDTGPCGPITSPLALDDVAGATEVAVGTWIRCEGSSVFAALEGADVGLELTADGRFFRLYESADGLIRGQGLHQEGRWLVNDVYTAGDPPTSSLDLGLKLAGSGYFPVDVTVHDQGDDGIVDVLRLTDSMSGASAGYVRWSGAPPAPGVPPGVGDGPCGHPTDPVELSSSDQLTELLVGAWTVCAGEPFGPGIIGAEFAADGTFDAYVRSADGQVTVHDGSEGAMWRLWPFDEPFDVHNGAQVDVVYADGSTRILQPEIFSSPLFMTVWPDAGLLAGAPEAIPAPVDSQPVPVDSLPPTGMDAPTNLLLLGGALVVVGLLAAWSTRRLRVR